MHCTATLDQPSQTASVSRNDASIEKILEKYKKRADLGGWATMGSIMGETSLDRQDVVVILRGLMRHGRLESILGNSPSNHRYRLKSE